MSRTTLVTSWRPLMRAAPLLAVPLLMLTAACGASSGHPSTGPVTTVTVTATPASTPTLTTTGTSPTPTTLSSVSSGRGTCLTSGLSLRLGAGQGAAGSVYQPIVFTNTSG